MYGLFRKWARTTILSMITISLVVFFYIQPGFSENLWTWLYNVFSALILVIAIGLYTIAIMDSYAIRAINTSRDYPGSNPKWSNIWTLYEKTFMKGNRRTTVPAQNYFNMDSLLALSSERIPVLAILKAMPGTYTGLGILGTFIGFSAGLSNFNTSSTESMQESIKSLLSGINTAFNTSIVGVVLSIVFNFCFLQPLLKRLEHDCNALTDRLDEEFYVDGTDHLKEIFAFEEEGTTYLPRDYTRQMLKELKSHSVSLANFSTDLSDNIKNLADALVASYHADMSAIIDREIKPLLGQLAAATDKLITEKSESADQALEGIVARLNQTLTDFMREFRENVAGQTKREMEGLASQLKLAGESVGSLPGMLEGLRGTFTEMTERSVKAMNETALQGSTLQAENISELRRLAEQVKTSTESFTKALAAADSQNKHAEKIAASFEEVADAANVAVSDLRRAFNEFQAQNLTLAASIAKEAEGLRVAVASAQSASQGFRGLDEALAKNFEAVNAGLLSYRETTKESLEKYLESYSGAFSQFAGRLSGAVENLGDLVGELTEVADALKRK